ncbi:hypothetical protein [Devosia sp. DBB001]|nr:hypothetical protein [Devosia sp. DBB001]
MLTRRAFRPGSIGNRHRPLHDSPSPLRLLWVAPKVEGGRPLPLAWSGNRRVTASGRA